MLIVGGATRSRRGEEREDRLECAGASEQVARSMPSVAETGISSIRSPKTFLSATYSLGSPTGVDRRVRVDVGDLVGGDAGFFERLRHCTCGTVALGVVAVMW